MRMARTNRCNLVPRYIRTPDMHVESTLFTSIHPIRRILATFSARHSSADLLGFNEELQSVFGVLVMEGIARQHGAGDMEIELTNGAMVDEVGGFFAASIAPAGSRDISFLLRDELKEVFMVGMLDESGRSSAVRVRIEVAFATVINSGECRVSTYITCMCPMAIKGLCNQGMAEMREMRDLLARGDAGGMEIEETSRAMENWAAPFLMADVADEVTCWVGNSLEEDQSMNHGLA